MSRLVKIVDSKYVQIEEHRNPNICFNTIEYDNFEDYCTLRETFDPFEMFYENQELKDLIDTILNFSFFKEECPLNLSFEDNSKEDKAQNIFYNDEYCENNCNDNYKDCWLKYFKELQKAKGDVKNEN